MAEEAPTAVRAGSRWYDAMPDEEQVKEWFTSQPLHVGMQHGPYLGGIVVIGATEKPKLTKYKQNGDPYVVEVERAVFTPYVKVDTRIAYFWEYVRKLNGGNVSGEYVGVIEPVEQRIVTGANDPYRNDYLPAGFSVVATREATQGDKIARFLVCTMRVAIYERQSYAERIAGRDALPVLQGIDSKQSAILKRNGYADEFAVMKARTGAVGRALGVAGILTVGTGVATAEDMQEAVSGESAAGAGADAAVPPETMGPGAEGAAVPDGAPGADPAQEAAEAPTDDDALRQKGNALAESLRAFPDAYQNYTEWYAAREFPPFPTLTGPALKGAVIRLERTLDEAQSGVPQEAPDA